MVGLTIKEPSRQQLYGKKNTDQYCHDHVKFKNKQCTICNSIMWFIFNLQRKNKQLEMAWEYVHICTNNSQMNTSLSLRDTNQASAETDVQLFWSHVSDLLISTRSYLNEINIIEASSIPLHRACLAPVPNSVCLNTNFNHIRLWHKHINKTVHMIRLKWGPLYIGHPGLTQVCTV
jgi:hypothetical protein